MQWKTQNSYPHLSTLLVLYETHPTKRLHQSNKRHFPLNHLTLECNTLSASTASSNSKRIRRPPNRAKWRFPFNIQLDWAQYLRETRSGGWSESVAPPHLPVKLLLKTSLLSITPLSISNHTTFWSFAEPENSASTAGFSFPTLTPLRPLPLKEEAEDSLPFGSRRNLDFLTSQPEVANPQPHSYLQEHQGESLTFHMLSCAKQKPFCFVIAQLQPVPSSPLRPSFFETLP